MSITIAERLQPVTELERVELIYFEEKLFIGLVIFVNCWN